MTLFNFIISALVFACLVIMIGAGVVSFMDNFWNNRK